MKGGGATRADLQRWHVRGWLTSRVGTIEWITFGLLAVSFLLGVLWLIWPDGKRWEPGVNSLTLVAGVTGLVVERFRATRETRALMLSVVEDELRSNLAKIRAFRAGLRDPGHGGLISPSHERLFISGTETALLSGAFDRIADAETVVALNRVRDLSSGYNTRLDSTEAWLVHQHEGRSLDESRRRARTMNRPGGFLDRVEHNIVEALSMLGAAEDPSVSQGGQ